MLPQRSGLTETVNETKLHKLADKIEYDKVQNLIKEL